jgi:hypothetical protein
MLVARAIYYDYWELQGMYKLAQIYVELRRDFLYLIRLHKIFKALEMGKQEIHNVFELVSHNELQNLQRKSRIP